MRVLMSVTSWEASLVEVYLREQGLLVTSANDGADLFLSLTLMSRPVVIVETNLPDLDWAKVVRRLRSEHRNMSIFVLNTAKSHEDLQTAFAEGADDVILPGMPGAEIAARIRAVVTRRAGHAGPNVTIGALRLRMIERAVYWGPQKVQLTATQYNIFETIYLATPYSVSHEVLMAELYGVEEGCAEETVRVFISYMRDRLMSAGAPRNTIETVSGRGYRLAPCAPVEGMMPLESPVPTQYVAQQHAA